MKNLLMAFISCTILLYACNSSTENNVKTTDSLEQLLRPIRDSINRYPEEPRLKYNLAIIFKNAGKYKEALAVLDSMNIQLKDNPDPYLYFNYMFQRSELQLLTGDTINAIKTLEQFVMPGELTQASLNLANLYAETNNLKTIPFCDAMMKYDSAGNTPELNYFKGIYYYNTGEFEKALKELDESIRKDYNFLDAYMEKGRILYNQKKYNDAIKVYNLALSVSSTFADAYYWKAKCQEALGQKEEAKLNYQRAYGLDKTLIEAREAAEKL
jgi:tetratricopeptide (TPR) repeat protein